MIFFPLVFFADQAEVVYQINYTIDNQLKTGFIMGAFQGHSTDSLFLQSPIEFEKNIKSYDRYKNQIEIYAEIIDLTSIKNNAAFPIHKFKMGNEMVTINTNKITHMKLTKIWIKSAYHIKVLSQVFYKDTTWYNDIHKLTYPIGDEVGCRLHVYQFDSSLNNKELIDEFTETYMNPTSSASYYNYRKRLLQILYLNKVVIVELCGC
jgi:hypothetical protein